MAPDATKLLRAWQSLPKDWYSIYQWEKLSRCGYTEWISQWIEQALPEIRLATTGLRQRSFRVADHRGQIKLQTDIKQFTEKRFLRAMFNQADVLVLGKVVDYEVPLKETDDAQHGDIDLLCLQLGAALCIEAKQPTSTESILKAILQGFVYTSLVASRRDAFFRDFNIPKEANLTPAILTFASAQSGYQLKQRGEFPNLWQLTSALNVKLVENGIAPFRFFVVENTKAELETCLMTLAQNSDIKVVFCDGFALKLTEEHPCNSAQTGTHAN
jgi:hypothetical protein